MNQSMVEIWLHFNKYLYVYKKFIYTCEKMDRIQKIVITITLVEVELLLSIKYLDEKKLQKYGCAVCENWVMFFLRQFFLNEAIKFSKNQEPLKKL